MKKERNEEVIKKCVLQRHSFYDFSIFFGLQADGTVSTKDEIHPSEISLIMSLHLTERRIEQHQVQLKLDR